ncbi:MAG: hypothetical protein ISS49_08690 [Anaerolineae bacterium]|nr:hypothetical protein [Anaerolineae bacterium]
MEAEEHRQAAEIFVRALGYANDDRVRAVFIVGSTASGQGDAYSDVDILRNLLDVLHLDDRETWLRKTEMLHCLEAGLIALCEARWGPIAMFDDEDTANE